MNLCNLAVGKPTSLSARKRVIMIALALLLIASVASYVVITTSNSSATFVDTGTNATSIKNVPKSEKKSTGDSLVPSASLTPTASNTTPQPKIVAAPTSPKSISKKQDNSTALPKATVVPLPGGQPGNPDYASPNLAIHVTRTGAKSLTWTSDYTAVGYFLRFQVIGDCSGILDIPCTAPPIYASGTTSGSYTFTYAQGKTYGVKALVTVCVNENIPNCGTANDNYTYLDF